MDSPTTAVRPLKVADTRTLADVGRSARLELTFEARDGRTELQHAYVEPPLRVGRCLADGNRAQLIIASSAPGIFGGDRLQQTVTIHRYAEVELRSQSALQVHPSANPSVATSISAYSIERGASLSCRWDPVIPFPDAKFQQEIRIELEDEANLFWSDAFMCGREARGERWEFDGLAHELRLSRGGRLRYLERYNIRPSDERQNVRWSANDARYFGTVLIANESVSREAAAELHRELAAVDHVYAAADYIDDGLILARLMSSSGVAFHAARALATRFFRTSNGQPRTSNP